MTYLNDPPEDKERISKVLGQLLLLYALQAADYGLIAEYWVGNQITLESEGVARSSSY